MIERATLIALATTFLGCASSYRTFGLPALDDKALNVMAAEYSPTAKDFGLVGASNYVLPPGCEATLRITSFDNALASKDVCIKLKDQGVAIPQGILIATTGTTKVNYKRYCDTSRTEGVDAGCVWNRILYNNYPMSFTIKGVGEKGGSVPLARSIGLVRVLQNGRPAFSWTRKENPDARSVEIPASAITAPEFFRDPVEFGLYVLVSGADEAQAAAGVQYDIAQTKWSSSLSNAVSAAFLAEAPSEVRDGYECFKQRLIYLRAIAQKSDTDAARALTAMTSLNEKQQALAPNVEKAIKLDTNVRFASHIVEMKKIATVDGQTIAKDDIILALNATGNEGTLYSVVPGAAWTPVDPSNVGAINAGTDEKPQWLIRVSTTARVRS